MTPEEARIRKDERERCAAVADKHAPYTEEAIKSATAISLMNNAMAVHASHTCHTIAAALRSGTDTDYVCVRREELERFATSAALLLANAEGCAVNHYGEDHALHGTPGWLSDCAADVARLRSLLKEKGGENG